MFTLPGDGCNGPISQSPSFRVSTSNDVDYVSRVNEVQGQQSRLPLQGATAPVRCGLGGKPTMDEEGPAPNVNIAALEQQNFSWHAKDKESPISRLTNAFQQRTIKKAIDPAVLRMSDSYLEESVDTASNAAPSQLMMSTTIPKKHFSKSVQETQLWSPEGARLRKALVPPVKDKPAFNAFLFASPSSKAGTGFGDSSFYSGKTCYGGSSARRKKSLNTSLPYQSSLPLRKQVTAQKLNTSLNATTSSTAQRILETLDRMSTPLGDAKKIPQEESTNDSIISFTPSSYRRTSSIGSLRSVTRPLQLPSRGPPTSQLKALSQAELARNRNKVSSVDRRQADVQNSDFIVTQVISIVEPSVVREPIRPSLPREQPTCQVAASSGKLKSKKFSQHVSNRKDEDEPVPETPNLRTDFTLPITNINPISFSQSTKEATSVASSIPSRIDASALQFTFSTPIEERRPSTSNQSVNNSHQGFKFSSPIKASHAKVNAAGAEGGSKTSSEPAVGASSELPPVNFTGPVPAWGSTAPKPKHGSPDIGGTSSSFKSYSKWSGFNNGSSAASDVSSAAGFSLSPASSLKSGSVMDILGGKSSSSGAATTVTVTPQNGADNLLSSEGVKPVATTTTKLSGTPKVPPPQETDSLMAKFMQPSGSWECDVCMLSNKPEATKCIACEALKPGGVSTSEAIDSSNNSLSAMFKKPQGTWECDICMVQNAPSASRCIACEAPKPGLEAAGIVSKKAESSSSTVAIAPGGGFVFNSLPTGSTSSGTSVFKFGNSVSTPASSMPASGGFVFGQTKASSSFSASTTMTSTNSTGGFKFGASATSAQSTGVTAVSQSTAVAVSSFGSPNLNKTSTSLSNAAEPFQFGGSQNSTSDSTKSDNVSAVVEVTPVEKSNSYTNSGNSNSNKLSASGFVFGGMSGTPAVSSLTSSTMQGAISQPQSTFSFSASNSSASHPSPAAPLTNVKPSSGLFQFGATPTGPSANSSTGLGMAPSLVSNKSLTNGGFGAPASSSQTDFALSESANANTGIPSFGGFGQSTVPSIEGSSGLTGKRTSAIEGGAPSAKMFNFGSSNKESTSNGGFHFGGAAQSSAPGFGVNAAAASAPAPSGGFTFAMAAPKPSGPAAGGGFQFSTDIPQSSGFNFGQAAAAAMKPPEQSATSLNFKAGGMTANFNFGGVGQPSSAPFQFAAKPAENAASAAATFTAPQIPQLNGPGFGSVPSNMGSFNLGAGEPQRKVKKAIRRIQRR
ncbi:nuclear pore complex protein Nup153-like [Elysia marginata]|uniref:Nuclear pore complex protein Nup153 n=1 Tax=Elysia marginata TaxID=1093978 RepID=A0AAV4EX33_9GAST|nr:nuclear pore complex protein Nup153-like [Elysia marginata]